MTHLKVVLTFLLALILSLSYAQEKCATVRYNEQLKNKLNIPLGNENFELWLSNKIKKKRIIQSISKTHEETYQIPVVVHIIHNGEAEGAVSNIPLSQIEEQIKILNQDFRRTNPDAAKTPDLFKDVASDVNIEFKLALQDPDGAPTTGIVRVDGGKEIWYFEEGDEMKKLSYWPSEDYLNIWVANLGDNTLGYSQFPTSDVLVGLEEGSDISETDGVVINYKEFGRGGNANRRSRGRTVTHEIGHYLGIKHIWGDDDNSCTGDDYVEDTPNQGGPNNVCPGFPSSTCSNTSDMYMNFMDYTPDTCMNMFTVGQKERMRTILESSPRRTSLLTSPGLSAPTIYSLDVAIKEVILPGASTCEEVISPVIIIRNIGTTTLTEITVEYGIFNSTPTSVTKSVNVEAYDTAKLYLPPITISSDYGDKTIIFALKTPNGGTDERAENNSISSDFYYSPTVPLPYLETFESIDLFSVRNPDNLKSWEQTTTGGNGDNNGAAYIDLLSNQEVIGEKDYLITPGFSAQSLENLSLSFKYAYGPKNEFSNDALVIRISVDCGNSFRLTNEIYYNSGSSLATTTPSFTPFVPSLPEHWREECLNLSNYAGYDKIQIAFIATSGLGNNLYLDDIEIKSGDCNGEEPLGNEEEKSDNLKLNIYPNPNDGKMTLDLKFPFIDDLDITIVDPLGQVVFQKNVGKTNNLHHTIELPNLSTGIHVVKIKGNKINLNKKVIIRK